MIKNGRPVTVEADSNTIDAALLYALPDEKIAQISEWISYNFDRGEDIPPQNEAAEIALAILMQEYK